MGLLCSKLAGHPSLKAAGIPAFISPVQPELLKGSPESGQAPEAGAALRGREPVQGLHSAGQASDLPSWFPRTPRGPSGKTLVSTCLSSVPSRGDFAPLMFSTVALGSQVLRTQPETDGEVLASGQRVDSVHSGVTRRSASFSIRPSPPEGEEDPPEKYLFGLTRA